MVKSEEIRENPVKPIFLKNPLNPRKTKRMPVSTTVILSIFRDPAGIHERARGLPVAMGVVGDSVSWVVKHLGIFGLIISVVCSNSDVVEIAVFVELFESLGEALGGGAQVVADLLEF